MSKKNYVLYGHSFEIIEDEDNSGISKRSKKPYEEIVTDEKGRQRFHGAFTGGFSAGYFNTVGSKHGWVPTSFTSTKGKKTNFESQRREDFMDDEDLGEFGIVSSKLKLKSDYDTLNKNRERKYDMANSLEFHLEGMLSLKDDINIGVSILKSMGWKYGQGIGEKLSRRNLEKMRVLERQKNGFNLEKVKEFEKFAPDFKFAPDDVVLPKAEIKKNRHGIGYKGLTPNDSISNESKKKTSHIFGGNIQFKGQAFGVGAFEGEDEDIYSMPDMSEYDFELVSRKEKPQIFSSNDAEFLKIEDNQKPRKTYYSDRVPHNFDCKHKPFKFDSKLLPENILKLKNEMSSEEKKVIFAEGKYNITNVPKKDSRNDEYNKEKAISINYFPNNPMKTYRYNQFVDCIKKGIILPMPVGMSKIDWEKEIDEFKQYLPGEMIEKYDNIKKEIKPLAQFDYIEKMKEMISNKFVKSEDNDEGSLKPSIQDKPKTFHKEIIRTVQEWHPSHILCKLFNIKNPFPSSDIVGLLFNPNNYKYDSKNEWEKIKNNVSNVKSTVNFEDAQESDEQLNETNTNDYVDEEVIKVKTDILLAIFDNIEKNNVEEDDEIIPEDSIDPCISESSCTTNTNEKTSSEPTKLYNDKNNISEILKGIEKIKDEKKSTSERSHKRKRHQSRDKDYESSKKSKSRHSRSKSREREKHRRREKKDRDSKSPKSKKSKKHDKKSKRKKRSRSSSSNSLSDDVISRVVNDYLDKLIK
uniref:G-patch domain-containing protein n=1 Tax=Strongyloides stercoralis TaxID=6248 RepID=A0A0K0EFH1_STRER